jgi:hypothetical protein
MREIQRSGNGNRRHRMGSTEIQSQIAQDERSMSCSRRARQASYWAGLNRPSREADQIPSGLQHQQHTGQELGARGFLRQILRARFTKRNAEIGGGVEV